jgi:malonate-semialdehyde dehydrogenase (acetylating)/methylmalonate-semialdehyde dehydrogenase
LPSQVAFFALACSGMQEQEHRQIRNIQGSAVMREIDHFLAGGTAGLATTRTSPVYDPNTGAVQAHVRLGDQAVLDRAVAAAQAAQPAWAATNPQRRARVMFRFKELVEAQMDELARLL